MDRLINYHRKNIRRSGTDLIFQAISWLDQDEDIDDTEDEEKEYVIYLNGVTNDEQSIGIKITGFVSYYYVRVPDDYQSIWSRTQTDIFYRYLKKKLGKIANGLVGKTLVEKSALYPFQDGETQLYIRLCFNTMETFRKCKNFFYRPITLFSISSTPMEFKMYETNVDPLIRFTHLRDLRTAGWIKINKEDYKIDDNDQIIVPWKKVNPYIVDGEECEDIAPFRILSWDIECQSSKGFPEFPDANVDGDFISQIGCGFLIFGTETRVKFVFTFLESSEIKEGILIKCKDEKDLLMKFCDTIKYLDPDILTGYNTWGFDDKYLYIRLKKNGLSYLLNSISRIPDISSDLVDKKMSSGAYGHNEFNILMCPGRETFDLIMFIRREHKLDSYKLGRVAISFELDKGKEDMPYKLLFEILSKGNDSPDEMASVCEYCIQDAFLVIELMEKLCFMPNSIEMAKSTRVPISWLLLKGQQCKVFSQVAYESRLKNYVIPVFQSTPFGETNEEEEEEKKFKGATVLTARRGAYFEPVSALDFKSLYPSIMIAYNLCYSTFVMDEKYMNLPGVEYETIAWTQIEDDGSKNDFSFTFVQSVKGILPDILSRLWADRNKTKREMKKCKGTFRANVLNGKQLAIKVTMNSVYGFTGAGKGMMPCKPIAASVTAKGREMIAQTAKMAEESYSCITVYGDSVTPETSIMVRDNGLINFKKIKNLAENWIDYPGFKVGDDNSTVRTNKEYSESSMEVWNGGDWTKIKKVIRHKVEKKIYRVLTHTGYVEVTEDHSLINDKMEYVKPKEVKVGSKLYCGYPVSWEKSEKFKKDMNLENFKIVPEFDEINEFVPLTKLEKMSFIYGLFYADGSCGKYVYPKPTYVKYSWALNNTNKELLKKCVKYLKDSFETESKILETMESSGVYKLVIIGELKKFTLEFRELFYEDKTKTVPELVINNKSYHMSFMAGYYSGDGSRNEKAHTGNKLKVLRFDNKGQVGSSGLYFIMKSLGFDVSVNTRSDKLDVFRLTSSSSMRKDEGEIKKIELMDYQPEFVYDIETESGRFQAGVGDMIVKNTDSAYIKFDVDKVEFPDDDTHAFMREHFRLAGECANKITEIFKPPIELEFEKVMDPFLLAKKKRYAYLEWVDPTKPKGIDYKGIQLARRDNCKYIREISMKLLESLLINRDIEQAKEEAKKGVIDLLNNKIPLDKLVVSKGLNKYYKVDGMQVEWDKAGVSYPHVRLAQELKKLDPMGHPKPPDRVPYLFIKTTDKNVLQYERVAHPDYLGKNKIDSVYYLDKQLIRPVEDIMELVMDDPSVLYTYERQRKINIDEGYGNGITDYFGVEDESKLIKNSVKKKKVIRKKEVHKGKGINGYFSVKSKD